MKSVISFIFLIYKILDLVAAADTDNTSSNNNSQNTSAKVIIIVGAIAAIFVLTILIFCLCKLRRPKKVTDIREINISSTKHGGKKKRDSRDSTSSISKVPLMTENNKLNITTDFSKLQISQAPPQTPLTPSQPQQSAPMSSTQTTLTRVSESLGPYSQPKHKSTSEVVITPEVVPTRPHSISEPRDTPRSSISLSHSQPPYVQQSEGHDVYAETTSTFEPTLEQATNRSRSPSPYRQFEYETSQTFDTPMDPRLQTQSRSSDVSLFSDPNPQSSQRSSIEIPIDDPGDQIQDFGPRQRTSMQSPHSPYDETSVSGTTTPPQYPPERRGRTESYSFDDNPGPSLPGRPLQRSTPGSSPRSRRGRRGGNR